MIEYDEILDALQQDILSLDSEDRVFSRYLMLTDKFNAGICTEDLDADRFGMNKMLNMLSTETQVENAEAINPERTIYRIDIRNYGWDRQVLVNGQAFTDGWEAIVQANDYAVEFEGDEAEQLIVQTQTTVPWQSAASLLSVTAVGNLYYELIGVDVNQSLDDFILLDLGIDVVDNLAQGDVIRAGTTNSILSRQDRVAERHDIGVRQGAFWQSFEFDANGSAESIFDDPFGFVEDERDVVFTLPNGFMGFIIADAAGNIIEESTVLPDANQDDFFALTAVSCSGCHAAGFLPMVDEVRGFVEANRTLFNADDFEDVQEIYVPAEEFAEVVELDSEFFQRSLDDANIPLNVPEPITDVFGRFFTDVELADVAADLGIRPSDLSRDIALLDPQLQIVRSTSLNRNDFTALFEASLRAVQGFSQNQPVASNCDDAFALLED